MNAECNRVRENLNRYLDNDLSGREATNLVAHLETCVGCHHVYERLRAVKTALHQIEDLQPATMEATRLRAFARLAQSAHQKNGVKTAVRQNVWSWNVLMSPRVWQSVSLSVAAVATLVAVLFLIPQPHKTTPTTIDGTPLPGGAELSAMFDLHDVQGGGLTATDPTLSRSEAAEAHALLLARADDTVSGSL